MTGKGKLRQRRKRKRQKRRERQKLIQKELNTWCPLKVIKARVRER